MARNGNNGPIPNRSDQRVRRNKPDIEIDKVEAIGLVEVPVLGFDDPHPLIADFYASLVDSAQARYYEPSDWQFARVTLHFLDQLVKSGRPSGQMLATVNTALSNLLVSEGDRRRVRIEIERGNGDQDGKVIDVADMFRQRLAE